MDQGFVVLRVQIAADPSVAAAQVVMISCESSSTPYIRVRNESALATVTFAQKGAIFG